MTYIVGLNAYHGDSSACIIRNGELLAAAEEERFRRIKHWAGFPSMAVQFCLREAGITLDGVDHIAINQDSSANKWQKLAYLIRSRPSPRQVLDRIKNRRERSNLLGELRQYFPESKFTGQVHSIEHHLCHLASAYLVSPFQEALVLSVDGFGDFSSAAWGVGRRESIAVEGKVLFPHSLGIFYQAITQFLGFPHYGDEYKVMGLAPYGQPSYLDKMRQILLLQEDGTFKLDLRYFRHHKEKVEYEWSGGSPRVGQLYSPELSAVLGVERKEADPLTQRHKDIARSAQAMYELALFHLVNSMHKRHKIDSLAIAGGCAMNSVANGKLHQHTPIRHLYVQSAAGDAGGAIGAAVVVSARIGGRTDFVMDHAYWGPAFGDQEVSNLINSVAPELEAQQCTPEHLDNTDLLCEKTAKAIAAGKVVGWFQGRMEWGPRALGNRSIVCDPRRADMKDILNRKIKRRESFRPFAPSILREEVPHWFEFDDDVPFMMQVHQIKEPRRALVPAVTHVDGSGRLQTVKKQANPLYYKLIEAFARITSVPMVLNTSFNENEPVVCSPKEALDCFLRTKMDVLVLGNHYIERAS